MKNLRRWLVSSLVVLLGACGARQADEVGGETHWLSACKSDATCGGGLSCLCGRCTAACHGAEECSGFSTTAVCAASSDLTDAVDCATSSAEKLCVSHESVSLLGANDCETAKAQHPERRYAGTQSSCITVDFACAKSERQFSDACGCGCERLALGNPACAGLDTTACHSRTDCRVLTGAPIDLTRQCSDSSQAVELGCADAVLGCKPVVTIAADSDGKCFAFATCVPAGFSQDVPQACRDSVTECSLQSNVPVPEGKHSLHLEMKEDMGAAAEDAPKIWMLNLELNVSGNSVVGWLAATATEFAESDVRYTAAESRTAGSGAVSGVVRGSVLTLDRVTLPVYFSPQSLELVALSMSWDSAGKVRGSASGHYQYVVGGDQLFGSDFNAAVAGGRDTLAPALRLQEVQQRLPIDSVQFVATEPVADFELELNGSAVNFTLSDPTFQLIPTSEVRPEFSIGVTLEPLTLWSSSALAIALSATDAAGNRAKSQFSPIHFEPAPNTASNLDLELGTTEGWLGNVNVAHAVAGQTGSKAVVVPEQGQFMLSVRGGRAAGYLVAGNGMSQLCFQAGIADQLGADVVHLSLVSSNEKLNSQFAFANPSPGSWSGFSEFCAPLPAGAEQGFWFEVYSLRDAQQVANNLLIDDMAFKP